MNKLQGKVIVITGASSGIGAEMAKLFALHGAKLALLARRYEHLQKIAASKGQSCLTIAVDVGEYTEVEKATKQILDTYGRIDVWINNAGFGVFENVMDMSIHKHHDMMRVNYFGIVHGVKSVLPYMLERREGHIINIVSTAGKIGTAKAAAYSASKHAALGFTNSLRAELLKSGVAVSSVNPGPIATPFFDIADPSGNYVRKLGSFMLQPEQVAKAVLKVIVKRKQDVTLPRLANFGIKLLQLFPNALSGVYNRVLNRK